MKQKKQKKWLKPVTALLMLVVAVVLALFVINPLLNKPEDEDIAEQYAKLEEKYDVITYNEKTGALFVNNELVVMVEPGVSKERVATLAASVNASIADGMEDLGIYKFMFTAAMTNKKLNETIETIKGDSIVTDAYINTAFITETDIIEGELEEADPRYPDDSWNGAEWDILVPRDENWGMEAIHAPRAWGYLSQLNTVKVGLIDSLIDVTHEDITVTGKMGLTDSETSEYSIINVTTSNFSSFDDHGTHVGGIIAANWNGKGVSGVMGDKGELYYAAAYNTNGGVINAGYYTAFNYFKAIKILLDQGVQAINISQNTNRLISFAASRGNENAIAHLKANANLLQTMLLRVIEDIEENDKPDFVICVAAGNANKLKYVIDEEATYGYREYTGWFSGKTDRGDVDAKYNNFISLMDNDKVMGRVIVVGSVGIDYEHSSSEETRYVYSDFSDIGARVDVAAPGEYVYSAVCGGYAEMSGTSMATPHVTGVAGLVFAANPELSGPQVKQIIKASTYDKFMYTGGSCGLIDAEIAVKNALLTVDHSIKEVISSTVSTGLDLCFIVDTTGSMSDDIQNAKDNMNRIIEELEAKGSPYRVALIDYRDFASRTSNSGDYPAKIQLGFTSDTERIIEAINGLTLGHGGDEKETVYSGIAESLKLDWDLNSKKVIIVIGDAAPLDPEPITGYTYEMVIEALYKAEIIVGGEDEELTSDASIEASSKDIQMVWAMEGDALSEYSVVDADFIMEDVAVDEEDDEKDGYDIGAGKDSAINVFTIDTGSSSSAESFFEKIAGHTGGKFADLADASQVSDAIIEHLEAVELNALKDINAEFGENFSNEWVEVYKDGEYAFSFELDDLGECKLYAVEPASYEWKIKRLAQSGEMFISNNSKAAEIEQNDGPWYGFALNIWYRNTMILLAATTALVVVAVCITMFTSKMKRRRVAMPAQQNVAYAPQQNVVQPIQPVEHIMSQDNDR